MNVIKNFRMLSPHIKATIIYVLASVLSKGLSIITLPIFTRLLSTDQIGIVGIYNSWNGILGPIASLALISGGFNVAMKEYQKERDSYCSSILALTCLSTCIFLFLYILFPDYWVKNIKLSEELIMLLIVGLFVQPGYDIYLAKSRYEYNYKTVFFLTFFLSVGTSTVSVIAILIAKIKGIENLGNIRLYANYILVYSIDAIICFLIIAKGKKIYNKNYWKFSLKLSIPLIINSLSAEVLGVSDRLMISQLQSNTEVGIYTTIYSLGSLPTFFWSAINMAYIPYLFEKIENTTEYESVRKSSNLIISLYGVTIVFISLFSPEIIRIFATNDYMEAVDIVPIIALAVFYIAIANLYSNILLYYKKTNYIMICTIVAAIVNVTLNYVLIPVKGYKAASYTTLISYLIMAVLQRKFAKMLIKKSVNSYGIYDEKVIILIQLVVIVISFFSVLTSQVPLLRYVIILGIVIAVFGKKDITISVIKNIMERKNWEKCDSKGGNDNCI